MSTPKLHVISRIRSTLQLTKEQARALIEESKEHLIRDNPRIKAGIAEFPDCFSMTYNVDGEQFFSTYYFREEEEAKEVEEVYHV